MVIFSTPRLLVRRFTQLDKDAYFQISGSEEVMRYIRPASTKEENDQFIVNVIEDYKKFPVRGRWAVVERVTDRLVGSFAIIPIPSQPEKTQLGYALIPSVWGKGLASELAKAGLDWFFENDNETVIYGVTEIPNIPSQQVLLKAGFKPDGSFTDGGKELLLFKAERI
jgi:RimJ/RimL family protein N-acetyltransferase